MARPRKNWTARDERADVQPESSDVIPGMAAGLEVTSPPKIEEVASVSVTMIEAIDTDTRVEMVEAEVSVSAIDPAPVDAVETTISGSIVAVGQLYNKAGELSAALSKHLRTSAGEPELHSFLHRMQTILGEFRHAVEQTEESLSAQLREAIVDAIAA